MYERTVLSNGLRVLVAPMPQTHSVSIGFFIGTGSRYETDEAAGASHFIEHMMFKGTRKRPTAGELAEAIEGVGGISNAGTGREMTDFWVKVARNHFPVALDVLVDMLRESVFDAGDIERERQVIIEEIKMTFDAPDELVTLAISELQWPGNPAGRDIAGTRESVACMSRDQLVEYVARHYGPSNTILSIAGNVSLQGVMDAVRDHLSDWQGGARQTFQPIDGRDRNGPSVQTIFRSTEQANVCLSVPAFARNDPRRFPLRMLNGILGEGMSSRLFQEIREKQALAYSVGSYIETLDETGVIGVYAGVDPEQTVRMIGTVLKEWDRICQEPVTSEELDRAREFHKGRMLLSLEDTMTVASWNGRQELLQGDVMSPEAYLAAMDAVTVEEVQSIAQQLLDPSKVSLAIVGPFGTEDAPDSNRFRRLLPD